MPKKIAPSPAVIILIAGLILVILLRIFSPIVATDWPKPGDAAPNLNTFPVEGTMPDTTNRVVLLDFWASWCGPCRLTLPLINELNTRYGSRGLLTIGVSVDAEKGEMTEFLKRYPVSFTNVRDAFGHLAQAYNASALPRTFIIGADGKIIGAHAGFNPAQSQKEYEEQIEQALKAAGK